MKPGKRLSNVMLAVGMLFAAGAVAQVDNDINVLATGGATSIQIDIDMDIGGILPTSWVGWVVDRETIGVCEPEVRVGALSPFEVGPQTYQLNDPDVLENLTYKYRVYALDDQGARQYLGSPPEFPPGYYHDDYASLGGTGIVAKGTLVDLGWTIGIQVCSGFCWEFVSFISDPPPDLAAGAGTGVVVQIEGSLGNEFEGPFIGEVTDWTIIGECGAVPNEETSWGGIKARYR